MPCDLPIGFMTELAQNKAAMQTFSALSESERDRVVARARSARSRAELRLVVQSLSQKISAREYF